MDNITRYLRRLPASQPVLATLSIALLEWQDFQRLDADNPDTTIVSYTDSQSGMVTAYVGCISDEARDLLEAAWN